MVHNQLDIHQHIHNQQDPMPFQACHAEQSYMKDCYFVGLNSNISIHLV